MILSPANVAQVKQISPFRYPGEKTWLVPGMTAILRSMPTRPNLFLEPFAGGASVSLAVADQDLAARTHLVEKDPSISAVWNIAIAAPRPDLDALTRRILSFRLERQDVIDALALQPPNLVEHAFQTILRNRVQRGGIMAPGAGLLKEGEKGKGLASRWYPETLVKRLLYIRVLADLGRLAFTEGDALQAIASAPKNAFLFVDPLYTAGGKAAGQRLYALPAIDHARLLDLIAAHQGPVVANYDDNSEIRQMAAERGIEIRPARMKNTHHTEMTDLLLVRNLPA